MVLWANTVVFGHVVYIVHILHIMHILHILHNLHSMHILFFFLHILHILHILNILHIGFIWVHLGALELILVDVGDLGYRVLNLENESNIHTHTQSIPRMSRDPTGSNKDVTKTTWTCLSELPTSGLRSGRDYTIGRANNGRFYIVG